MVIADDIGKRASMYDIIHGELPEYGISRVRASMVDSILPTDQVSSVLDVGCGAGQMMRHVQKHYPSADVKGVDISVHALERKCSDLDVRYGIAQQIPFHDDEFDMVMCTDVLEHIPTSDIQLALSELRRVSKRYVLMTISALMPLLTERAHEARYGMRVHEIKQMSEWWGEQLALAHLVVLKMTGGRTHPNYLCEVSK